MKQQAKSAERAGDQLKPIRVLQRDADYVGRGWITSCVKGWLCVRFVIDGRTDTYHKRQCCSRMLSVRLAARLFGFQGSATPLMRRRRAHCSDGVCVVFEGLRQVTPNCIETLRQLRHIIQDCTAKLLGLSAGWAQNGS